VQMLVVIYAVLTTPVTVLAAMHSADAGAQGGHLPWMPAQLAFATAPGLVVLVVGSACVLALLYIAVPQVGQTGWRQVARAVDVTDVPSEAWYDRGGAAVSVTERWLGRDGRTRQASVLALALAALLALGMVGAFVASGWYLFATPASHCTARECAPSYPLYTVAMVDQLAIMVAIFVAQHRWLGRIEKACGVWFRYRDAGATTSLYYVRRHGVTPEAASAALARFAPPDRPMAYWVVTMMLVEVPAIAFLCAGLVLTAWLPLQWVPG
jgi:hypothetical protein